MNQNAHHGGSWSAPPYQPVSIRRRRRSGSSANHANAATDMSAAHTRYGTIRLRKRPRTSVAQGRPRVQK